MEKVYGKVKRQYTQKSVRSRIEALFLDNLGKVITRDQILQVAADPKTKKVPENWHQRLSELRTDHGYTIYSARDTRDLKVSEYMLLTTEKRESASGRVSPSPATWKIVLEQANYKCQWTEGGRICGLNESEQDPIGGGTVRLTPDHRTPHSVNPNCSPNEPNDWQALCGRHHVMKKNYWDDSTGWLNVHAIVQASSVREKLAVYTILKAFFQRMRM